VAQSDGGNVQSEINSAAPTIPLHVSFQIPEDNKDKPPTGRPPRKRRTITDSTLGAEVLKRVRTATLSRMIEQTIGGFNEDEDSKPTPVPEQFKSPQDKETRIQGTTTNLGSAASKSISFHRFLLEIQIRRSEERKSLPKEAE